jgi:hypothetical protein
MSPEFVLHRMKAVVEKHGFIEAAPGRFKPERKACSTAPYAPGLSEMFGPKKYWVEIETGAGPPLRLFRSG